MRITTTLFLDKISRDPSNPIFKLCQIIICVMLAIKLECVAMKTFGEVLQKKRYPKIWVGRPLVCVYWAFLGSFSPKAYLYMPPVCPKSYLDPSRSVGKCRDVQTFFHRLLLSHNVYDTISSHVSLLHQHNLLFLVMN